MPECRWSGWPGAWCLDCGRADPREVMLAEGEIAYQCTLKTCRCTDSDAWLSCPHFTAVYGKPLPSMECSEPGSKRHDPYAASAARQAQ